MTVRIKEGVKDKTGGTGIEVTDNEVINLILRSLNNLIKVNGDNEVYVDLQLDDNLLSTATLPVGVTVGRVLQANGFPMTGTMISAKTTSGDWIKILYGDNGEIKVDNGTGVWKNITTAFFKTQAEYNALPATKTSDGNLYIIVDTHIYFMPFEELIELAPEPDAILDELNQYGKGYAEYYYNNGDIQMEEEPVSGLPRADAYWKTYKFSTGAYHYFFVDTNLTEQEMIDGHVPSETIESILNGEWYIGGK